ncbi:glutaminyl-tRNA synthase (glutamine-hydrolyzing) subunit B [Arachidicoccus ginsenosidimutans]|uniref:Asp-tRNA(Asn)/Glu-tRNA(Gln) amidotransferase subunit GatB n=1 Tax=Arachidicoccus sp. BS20 TaxID=1850526 RepID=UPI0007F1141B|nr:Asp-tRNA(Asn)/Glu-tRNA(Gln) amidotransferase subunit GatB [Arachidicoccus sp. BS20]ANI89357.1 glutaminyl-tRNA synthase (glutamine-hydrolyzing) subunit B [Arachidicoccus sp. BS20]
MTSISDKYEAVIGLEIHAQLATQSKLFCADDASFGAAPNTHISEITLAHPGTLPKLNKKAVEYAVKLGLACNCEISKYNFFARKNYFYPDLPKGWQTSQHTHPICIGGTVLIKTEQGKRLIQMHHIHLEEDAGKSIHDVYDDYTCVDLNRAGTPLVEIVSEPDMHTADEAWQYVNEIRKLVRWLGVSDGNMEEGSLRCDANVSIRLKGDTKLGTRAEVKNLNSTRNIKKAIEYEIERMIKLVESGGKVQQQTRSFDASTDTTFSIRDKEEANDYRYFPEPDLAPLNLSDEYINSLKSSLPALPNDLIEKYQTQLGLSEYDAEQLCSEKEIAVFFENVLPFSNNYKAVANWINGPIRSYVNDAKISLEELSFLPKQLAELIAMIDEGKVNFSVASSQIFPELVKDKNASAIDIATNKNLLQTSDNSQLESWINEAISRMPDKVKEYQKGKKGLIGLFVGEVKKLSKGKADPKKVTELLQEKLSG